MPEPMSLPAVPAADDGRAPADLLPATGSYPTETARYQTVVLTDIPGADPDELAELNEPVDLGEDEDLKSFTRPGEGMIVTTEQRWRSLGVTLGRLLHSLALAPGESTRVSVVDWNRQDAGTKREDTGVTEELGESAAVDRSVAEVSDAVANEQQYGGSVAAQAAVSATAAYTSGMSTPMFSSGIQGSLASNAGAATAVSRSSGSREVAARTAQHIAGRTKQIATSLRNQHVAVVRETQQAEGARAGTRVVTNYNHMHAMTVQYYEVVQAYEVTTEPVLVERCLFVPMKILTFTSTILKRYAGVLAAAAPKAWQERMAGSDPFRTTVTRTGSSAGTPLGAADASGTLSAKAPGRLKHITAATDGDEQWVYGVNQAGDAVRWNAANSTWTKLGTGAPSAGFERIAVGNKQAVWALAADRTPYSWDGTRWQKFRTEAFRCLAVGADGSVWASGTDSGVYRLAEDRSSWQEVPERSQADDLAVISRDRAWCVHTDGHNIGEWSAADNGWQGRPGQLMRIAAAGDGSVWGVNAQNDLVQWISSGSFVPRVFGELKKALVVAPVSAGDLWVLSDDGTPYHLVLGDTAAAAQPREYHEEEGEVEALKVFWDADVIRGLQLTMRGATGATGESRSFGDTDVSLGLSSGTHVFAPGDRLATAKMWSGTATGGNVRRIELTTLSGKVSAFGNELREPSTPESLTVRGSVLCGLYCRIGRGARGEYLASLGFWVRGEAAASDVLEHLNDNAAHYSRVIWAHADELELSRMLATYRYTPPGESTAVPLAVRLDPRPVAMTGNYLAFRWHFASKRERKRWLRSNVDRGNYPKPVVLGLPSRGVFAEAVLGRANSAEKLDLTRFWNWQDSPIQVLPGDIAPVSTESRAGTVDLTSAPMAAPAARINPVPALPNPTGLDAALRTVATANLFRDMSGLAGAQDMLKKGLELAAANDQAGGRNATDAMRIATQHLEKMTDLAIDALPLLLGPEGAVLAGLAGAPGIAKTISEYGGQLNLANGSQSRPQRGDGRGRSRKAGGATSQGRSDYQRGGAPRASWGGPSQAWIDEAWRLLPQSAERHGLSVADAERRFRDGLARGAFDGADGVRTGPVVEDMD